MPTVWPRGQLDLAGSAVLRSVLPRMLAEEPDGIIVDLSGISVHKPTRAEAWPPVRRARRTPGATSKVRERFPPEPQSLAAARAMAAAACARWQVPERPTGRVQVVLTELVGNAVRHAGTPIEVVLRRTARYVHLAVHDEDHRPARLRGPDTPDAESGRGLLLVDAFSGAWGCTPTRDGKAVWATVRYRPAGRWLLRRRLATPGPDRSARARAAYGTVG